MIEQGSDEWRKQRIGNITGSRIGSILGLNKYQTADDVLRDMVREYFDAEPEFQGNEHTERGHRLEPIVAGLLEEEYGWMLLEYPLVKHPEISWLAASPDRVAYDRSFGVEIKAPTQIRTLKEKPDYEAQIRLCMECLQIDTWHYVSYVEGQDPHIETVKHDPAWLPSVMPILREFNERYKAALENPDQYLEPKSIKRNDADWEAAAENYREAKAALDAATKAEKAAKKVLIDLAGGMNVTGAGMSVTKVSRIGAIDWPAVAELNGWSDAYLAAHRKPGSSSYRVTVKK